MAPFRTLHGQKSESQRLLKREGRSLEDGTCCCCCKKPSTLKISCRNRSFRLLKYFPVTIILFLMTMDIFIAFVDPKSTESDGIFWPMAIICIAALLIWMFTWGPCNLCKCYRVYLQQYLLGRRKPMKKHNLELSEVLLSLYKRVPTDVKNIEEAVSPRLMNICNEIQKGMCFNRVEINMSGSTAERFNAPISSEWLKDQGNKYMHALMSDYDFMLAPDLKINNVNENSQYHLILEDGWLQPGFVYVVDKLNNTRLNGQKIMKDIHQIVRSSRLDLDLLESDVIEGCCPDSQYVERKPVNARVKIQGPALSIVVGKIGNDLEMSSDRFVADVLFSLKCSKWPSSISNWVTRSKNWPNDDVVKRIISEGCHVVPKPQDNDWKGLTWRFSFSSAEVEVSKSVPETARMCFIGIKVITKDYLSIACRRIKSYHMKSIFLYTLEGTDPDDWSADDALKNGFEILLKNVEKAISSRDCPHFWIPQVNLFKKLTKNESNKLLKVLKEITKSPEKYIEDLVVKDTPYETPFVLRPHQQPPRMSSDPFGIHERSRHMVRDQGLLQLEKHSRTVPSKDPFSTLNMNTRRAQDPSYGAFGRGTQPFA